MNRTPQWVLNKIQKVNVQGLTELDLNVEWNSDDKLTEIPHKIFELDFLTSLKISRHKITEIPEAIATLHNLQTLYLGDNQISEIPEAIAQLQNLKILSLRDNEISKIPKAIAKLKNLQILDLESNQISEIPEAIAQLENLEILDLGWNKITKIPEFITYLPSLKTLGIYNNQIEVPPPKIVAQGLAEIRNYYEQFNVLGLDYLYEAKLLIVGEEGSGKTTLVKRIFDPVEDKDDIHIDDITHGIEINEWHFPYKDRDFRVNIWDFSGQEKYYPTHRFFLTDRSLYLIVADERKDNTEFDYWLNLVHLFSKNSSVILLLNERQGNKRKIDENAIRRKLPNLKEIISIDLSKTEAISTIIPTIQKHLISLKHIGDRLPSTWINFRTFLETDSQNSLNLKDYYQLCDDFGIRKTAKKLLLSHYLHDLGIIVHIQDDPLLKDIVILHPEWATNAVAQMINHPEIIANYGTFSRQDLSIISIDTAFEMMQDKILNLMQKFQLCYRITPTANNYICPQLLDVDHPRYKWHITQNLVVRYRYQFMPKGIVSRLIVTMHQYIKKQQLVWRNGVVLHRDGTDAEIIENEAHHIIQIRVRGEQRCKFISDICHEIDLIHGSYYHLTVQKFIPCNCQQCQANPSPYFYDEADLHRYVMSERPMIKCSKSSADVNVRDLLAYTHISVSHTPVSEDHQEGKLIEVIEAENHQFTVTKSPVSDNELDLMPKLSKTLINGLIFVFLLFIAGSLVLTIAHILSWIQGAIACIILIMVYVAIGVLVLRHDDKAKDKSTFTLMKAVLKQLPPMAWLRNHGK